MVDCSKCEHSISVITIFTKVGSHGVSRCDQCIEIVSGVT